MTELFKWQPANLIDWEEGLTWRTLATRMESGKIKTRKKWNRPRRSAQHVVVNYLEENEVDEIRDFFNARAGGYEQFYIPSWIRETRVTSDITAGNTIINIGQTSFFVSTPNVHGYFLHLSRVDSIIGIQEVLLVNTIISTFQLGLTSPTVYGYPTKSFVQRAYPMRFVNDTFRMKRKGYNIYEAEVQMAEAI